MYNYLPTYKDYSMLGIIGIALGLTCYYVIYDNKIDKKEDIDK